MKKTILWLQELLISMGNALFHPYKDNSPPSFEAQPLRDDPYKNRGIAQVKVTIVLNFKERFNWLRDEACAEIIQIVPVPRFNGIA